MKFQTVGEIYCRIYSQHNKATPVRKSNNFNKNSNTYKKKTEKCPTLPPPPLCNFLDDQVIHELLKSINDYTVEKVQVNQPSRRRSMFAHLVPVTKAELKKLLAVLIAMGITKKPSIKHYWKTSQKEGIT